MAEVLVQVLVGPPVAVLSLVPLPPLVVVGPLDAVAVKKQKVPYLAHLEYVRP